MKTIRSVAAVAATGVILAWLLLGCGASQREKTINATFAATEAASAQWVKFDLEHQREIVAQAITRAATKAEGEQSGKAALDAWRMNQLSIEQYRAIVYKAIAAAVTIENDETLQGMIAAALQLSDALKAIGAL